MKLVLLCKVQSENFSQSVVLPLSIILYQYQIRFHFLSFCFYLGVKGGLKNCERNEIGSTSWNYNLLTILETRQAENVPPQQQATTGQQAQQQHHQHYNQAQQY